MNFVFLSWMCLMLVALCRVPVFALDTQMLTVTAVGEAPIEYDEQSARMRALRLAIEEASLLGSADVQSSQVMRNGNLTADYMRVRASARVIDINILSEGREGDVYRIQISARVAPNQLCQNVMSNHYRKSVAVTGFAMQTPAQASMGRLGAVDRELPALLVQDLNAQQSIRALSANYMTLYPNIPNAPTQLMPNMTLTRAVEAAKELGVQFIVSGVIRDMSMENPDAARIQWWHRWVKYIGFKKLSRTRHFVFEVFVHDGYSGALVFQSRYHTHGIWNEKTEANIGFGSAKYFSTDYGKHVQQLLDTAVDDLHHTIQCQPFMANISQVDGHRIYIKSGAESGLRPGDYLSIYRTREHFDRSGDNFWQIVDTRLVAQVKQVQPFYTIAELSIDVDSVNLQMDDLVMAW